MFKGPLYGPRLLRAINPLMGMAAPGLEGQDSSPATGLINSVSVKNTKSGGPRGFEAEKIGGDLNLDDVARELSEPEDLLESDDDAPIIRLINALITEAIKENASDIHVEPFESRLSIRFRVDGVLREVLEPPRQISSLLCSRIKVMAQLDIAEKRLPQDGRIALKVANRPVDIRVSTLPSGHGERVVMRILDKQAGRLDLHHLGMDDVVRKRLSSMIEKPHGIILVTGPTGSGKTTTLYSILSALNDSTRNILTVEDPVEYDLDGIGQTPVNTKVDMTFAKGLRAVYYTHRTLPTIDAGEISWLRLTITKQ